MNEEVKKKIIIIIIIFIIIRAQPCPKSEVVLL